MTSISLADHRRFAMMHPRSGSMLSVIHTDRVRERVIALSRGHSPLAFFLVYALGSGLFTECYGSTRHTWVKAVVGKSPVGPGCAPFEVQILGHVVDDLPLGSVEPLLLPPECPGDVGETQLPDER